MCEAYLGQLTGETEFSDMTERLSILKTQLGSWNTLHSKGVKFPTVSG